MKPNYTPWTLVGVLTAAALPVASAQPAPNGRPVPKTICGTTTDWQDVEQYDGTLGRDHVSREFVDRHERPVGNIKWKDDFRAGFTDPGNIPDGSRWCTTTLITNNLAITAGHCFDIDPPGWRTPRDDEGNPIAPTEIARNMEVSFNWQLDGSGNQRADRRFAITRLREYRLGSLDYAVIQLAGTPGTTFGSTRLASSDLTSGDELTLIQHPEGRPKKIDAGTVSAVSAHRVTYGDVDTLFGSSGTGLLDWQGRIVGVHTGGSCTTGGGDNAGVTIEAIADVSPIVANNLRGFGQHAETVTHGDFNGDGFDDIAIGMPHYSRTRSGVRRNAAGGVAC